MKKEYFKKVLNETIEGIKHTLGVKAMEYMRNDNAMHNFDVGAKITGQTREKVIFGFALKHNISIADIRNDIEKGKLPSKEIVEEKFGDAINYLILEKASILDKIENKTEDIILHSDIATVEALHDLLLDDKKFSLNHYTLKNGRNLINKLYNHIEKASN